LQRAGGRRETLVLHHGSEQGQIVKVEHRGASAMDTMGVSKSKRSVRN
jgi:hypothetical protein